MLIPRKKAFQEEPASVRALRQEHTRLCSTDSTEARVATTEPTGGESYNKRPRQRAWLGPVPASQG